MHDLAALLTALDTDGDAIADAYETDADNDGCLDVIEASFTDAYYDGQVDGNGFTNDGLITGSDGYQTAADGDNNTVADYRQATINTCPLDIDNDGIADSFDMTVTTMVLVMSTKAVSLAPTKLSVSVVIPTLMALKIISILIAMATVVTILLKPASPMSMAMVKSMALRSPITTSNLPMAYSIIHCLIMP